jgi:hypothetical protein
MHTAGSEWLGNVDTTGSDYHSKIIAQAAMWYGRVSPEVKADAEEFTIQAQGMIRREASVYGEAAEAAAAAATEYLSFLRRREGASGLPQIEQTVAPDGVSNQPTPLPDDVFDNFAPPIHPINEAVSGSEDSNRAPLLQMNAPGAGQQETLHDEAPAVNEGPAPFSTTSVAIGHVMDMRQFEAEQRREAAAAADPSKAAKTAADGDSSQANDYQPGMGSADQNGSAAMDRLVEATGLSAEEVRQRFNNPQEAVKVLDSLSESGKKAASKTAADGDSASSSWNDPHGDFQHDGGDTKCNNCAMGNHTGSNGTPGCSGGSCQCGCRKQASKEAASGLDQIQQTTAPDGVSQRPTPLPGDVAFPLLNVTEMTSDELVDPDPRAAVEKAAALDDYDSTSCRGCGESVGGGGGGVPAAVDGVRPSENPRTCTNCGTKNYVQRKASRSFTPGDAMAHPEFFKGYGFGRNWKTGGRLVRTGTAEFEAGLYAGITDNPEHQAGWLAAHAAQASRFEEFTARIAVHQRFTAKVASAKGLRTTASSYVAFLPLLAPLIEAAAPELIGAAVSGMASGDEDKTAARKKATTETDLSTSSPGTSPSPTGDTPINGPGKPGPLAGYESPAEAGGPGPYNGAPPYGRPVVPGAIAPAQIVPPEVTHTGPPNPFANQQTLAFRKTVQASLVRLAQED